MNVKAERAVAQENSRVSVEKISHDANEVAKFLGSITTRKHPIVGLVAMTPNDGGGNSLSGFQFDKTNATTAPELEAWLKRHAKSNIYFHLSHGRYNRNDGRLREDSVSHIRGLQLDIDPDKSKPYSDERKRLALVAADLMAGEGAFNTIDRPTHVVHSGGGLQAFWLFPEPLSGDYLEVIKDLNQRLASLGEPIGASGDRAVTNPAGLMRLPGTVNYPSPAKAKTGRTPTRAKWLNEADHKKRGNRTDLAALDLILTDYMPAKTKDKEKTKDRDSVPTGDLAPMIRTLKKAGIANIVDEDDLPEDLQAQLADILANDEAFATVWHGETLQGAAASDDHSDWRFSFANMCRKHDMDVIDYGRLLYANEHSDITNDKHGGLNLQLRQVAKAWRDTADYVKPVEHADGSKFGAVEDEDHASKPREFPAFGANLLDYYRASIAGHQDPLIKGIVSKKTLTGIVADSNVGKSLMLAAMASTFLTGGSWAACEVEKAGVIYLALEDWRGVTARVIGALQASGFNGDMQGLPFSMITDEIDLFKNAKAARKLIDRHAQHLRATFGVENIVIMIDTLADCHTGKENDTDEMKLVMKRLYSWCEEYSVFFAHHTPKNDPTSRGSGAIRAKADTMLVLEDHGSNVVIATVNKGKNLPKGSTLPFIVEGVTLPVHGDVDPEGKTAGHLRFEPKAGSKAAIAAARKRKAISGDDKFGAVDPEDGEGDTTEKAAKPVKPVRLSATETKVLEALKPVLLSDPEGLPAKALEPVMKKLKIGNPRDLQASLVRKGYLLKEGERTKARYTLGDGTKRPEPVQPEHEHVDDEV